MRCPMTTCSRRRCSGAARRSTARTGRTARRRRGAIFPIPQPLKTDLAEAKKLLTAAGFPDGFSTTFSFNVGQAGTAEPMAALLKESLAKIGIKVEIQKLPDAQMSTLINEKKVPFFTEGIVAWLPSMDYFYRNFYIGPIRWNYSSLDNAADHRMGPGRPLRAGQGEVRRLRQGSEHRGTSS